MLYLCNGHGDWIITQRTRGNIEYKFIIEMEATPPERATFLHN